MGRKIHKTVIALHCNRCGNAWNSSTYEIRRGRKCPYCNESSGERTVRQCLDIMLVPYMKEVYSGIGLTRYDFVIRDYKGRLCVIEFDGKQHFEHIKYFHRSKKSYNAAVLKDKIKTDHALRLGIRMLRISYKSEMYAGYWIWTLLNTDDALIIA